MNPRGPEAREPGPRRSESREALATPARLGVWPQGFRFLRAATALSHEWAVHFVLRVWWGCYHSEVKARSPGIPHTLMIEIA